MADSARSRASSVVGLRLIVALLLLLALVDPAHAHPGDDRLPALRLDWLTQPARRDAAEGEVDLIPAPREIGPSVGNFRAPGGMLKELRPALDGDYDTMRNRLSILDAKAKA